MISRKIIEKKFLFMLYSGIIINEYGQNNISFDIYGI